MTKPALLLFFLLGVVTLPLYAQPNDPPQTPATGRLESRVFEVQFSPDGRLLAASETKVVFDLEQMERDPDPEGSVVRLWEVATGHLLWANRSAANTVSGLLFSPDGKHLLCYGTRIIFKNNRTTEASTHRNIWEVTTGQTAYELELATAEHHGSLVFTSDGTRLIGNTVVPGMDADGKQTVIMAVKEWDAATGKLLRRWDDLPELVNSYEWVVAGDSLVTTHSEYLEGEFTKKKMQVWALADFSQAGSLTGEGGSIIKIAVAPDGRRIAVATEPADILEEKPDAGYLWDLKSPTPIRLTPPAGDGIRLQSLYFTPDGQHLLGSGFVVGEGDESHTALWRWDANTGQLLQTRIAAHKQDNRLVQAFPLPEGKSYLIFNRNGKPEQFSVANRQLIRVFE